MRPSPAASAHSLRGWWQRSVLAASWVEDRLDDLSSWAIVMLNELPRRLGRVFADIIEPGRSITQVIRQRDSRGPAEKPHASYSRIGEWSVNLILRILDLAGLPEILEGTIRALTASTPLTPAEIVTLRTVFGPNTVRYGAVRVCMKGILQPVWTLNRGRAFAFAHTICVPQNESDSRVDTGILVHEMVHVMQYERAGSAYIAQALRAQRTEGYGYGTSTGLQISAASGKRYRDFNREQQAQIVQDYFVRRQRGDEVAAYEPYVSELRRGEM